MTNEVRSQAGKNPYWTVNMGEGISLLG